MYICIQGQGLFCKLVVQGSSKLKNNLQKELHSQAMFLDNPDHNRNNTVSKQGHCEKDNVKSVVACVQ